MFIYLRDLVEYLVKPIELKQLVGALENGINKLSNHSVYTFKNGIEFDIQKKLLFKNRRLIKLTNNEYKLLVSLCQHEHRPVSNEVLEYEVWEGESVSILTLRSLMSRLRAKIGSDMIINTPEIGYTVLLQ